MLQPSFNPFPALHTERLLLRLPGTDDAGFIFALRSNGEVNRFLERPTARSIHEADAFISKILKGIGNNESVYWVIVLKQGFQAAGTICLWNIDPRECKADIGYELLPQFQGMGIMQEALLKVTEYGFETLQLAAIEAWTDVRNLPSVKLLEKNRFRRCPEKETAKEPHMAAYCLSKAGA